MDAMRCCHAQRLFYAVSCPFGLHSAGVLLSGQRCRAQQGFARAWCSLRWRPGKGPQGLMISATAVIYHEPPCLEGHGEHPWPACPLFLVV